MTVTPPSPEIVVQRIDAMMRELSELRRIVLLQQDHRADESRLAQNLFGSLGQGSWDEWEHGLDWERFES